jgi:hypothetical protein
MEKWKILTLLGLELWPLSHPARSQWLHRLDYRGSCNIIIIIIIIIIWVIIIIIIIITSFVYIQWPPLCYSGQSSWLQIHRSGFDSRRYQIFREVVGLERGPLSLVSTTEELIGRKNISCCIEIREYGRRNPSRWPRGIVCPQKLTVTSPTSDHRSVGLVRSRTQATEFSFLLYIQYVSF